MDLDCKENVLCIAILVFAILEALSCAYRSKSLYFVKTTVRKTRNLIPLAVMFVFVVICGQVSRIILKCAKVKIWMACAWNS